MALSILKPITNLKLFKRADSTRLPKKLHPYFLHTIAELMQEGFSLNQSLQFMQILMTKHTSTIQLVIDELAKGSTFEKAIQPLGYSISVVAQLFYAQRQGRFQEGLLSTSEQLKTLQVYKTLLSKSLAYPIMMSFFLVALLFGMRSFMLPHIASFITQEVFDSNILVQILVNFFTYLPQISIFIVAFMLINYLLFDFYFMRLPYLKRFRILSHLPIIRKWAISYCSYKVTREIGHFFEGGYSLLQTIDVITSYPVDPFLTEVATLINNQMKDGIDLPVILEGMRIFTPELPHVIHQGELTSQTAQKCNVYSEKLFNDLLTDITKKINYIQPILFIVIALLVMSMYLMMMLPMLSFEGL